MQYSFNTPPDSRVSMRNNLKPTGQDEPKDQKVVLETLGCFVWTHPTVSSHF